jgi:hypothetical protein
MKPSNRILSLLVATLGLSAFAAGPIADEFTHSYIAQAKYVQVSGGAKLFALGDSAVTVTNKLFEPDLKLSPSVWVYRNFPAAPGKDAERHFCDNLIVSFGPGEKPASQKVITIALANAKGLEKIEQGMKQNPRYLEDYLTGY